MSDPSSIRTAPTHGRACFVCALALVHAAACQPLEPEQLPPYGQVELSVDTDSAVPYLVNRLRVDLYAADGHWYESRDIARPSPQDWPLSFGIYSDDTLIEKRVIVRLRAYADGKVRDYLGERYHERGTHQEPALPSTLGELCTQAASLGVGQELTLRSGRSALTPYLGSETCTQVQAGGSVAALVQIEKPGTYRLGVSRASPSSTTVSAFLRGRCDARETELACVESAASSQDGLPNFTLALEAGTYYLLAGSSGASPVDLTLKVSMPDDWVAAPVARVGEVPAKRPLPSTRTPRLYRDSLDQTPAEEPLPELAIDRLALLTLQPGIAKHASILLHGACTGTMARLALVDGRGPTVNAARTCVDTENVRDSLSDASERLEFDASGGSAQGSFTVDDPCPLDPSPASSGVCVAGGTFVLGNELDGPERLALMNRFWIDRNEVTVARWRAALTAGFASPEAAPFPNNGPLGTSSSAGSTCTWSQSPLAGPDEREDFGLSCVSWYAARAFCLFLNGDLPTEAQWEYAALASARPHKTAFPWGGSDFQTIPCARAVFGRNDRSPSGPTGPELSCLSEGFGPLAVGTRAGADGDVTPELGIVGMGGGLAEWTLDAYLPHDSECWNAASLSNPSCIEQNATLREARGRSWNEGMNDLSIRQSHGVPSNPYVNVGFRCVYSEAPP